MTPTVAVSAIPFGLSLFPLLSCLDCTIARNLSFRLEKKLKRAIVHSGETVSWGRDMRIITIEVPGNADAMDIVVALCVAGLLRFEVRPRRHYDGAKMEDAAMRKIAASIPLRDAMVGATAKMCPIYFVSGSRIRVAQVGIFLGINCDPEKAARLIRGSQQLMIEYG